MGLTVEARLIWAMGSCRWSSNGLLQVSFHVFGWHLNCRAKGGKNRVKTDPEIGNSEGSKIMPKPCIPHTPERHPCAATVALLNEHFTNQYKSYCWWTKSCTTNDDDYPIIYRVLTIPGGAGFCPSTVCGSNMWIHQFCSNNFFATFVDAELPCNTLFHAMSKLQKTSFSSAKRS